MDRIHLQSLLFSTAILTFEELGFLLPDEEVNDQQSNADLKACSRIHFTGASEGWLSIRLYGGFLAELTANMLGEEEEPSEQDQADALGELSNVVCGNLLPAVAGAEAVYDLGAPEVQFTTQLPAAPAGESAGSCIVGVEDGRIELDVHVANPVASEGN